MEQRDIMLIEKYVNEDESLRHLYKEHIEFERRLEQYNSKHFLTSVEEVERKELQKKKLLGRDKMEDILRKYRKLETAN